MGGSELDGLLQSEIREASDLRIWRSGNDRKTTLHLWFHARQGMQFLKYPTETRHSSLVQTLPDS
jgi:hypothetical protein